MSTQHEGLAVKSWALEISEYGLVPVITGKLRTCNSLYLYHVVVNTGLTTREAKYHLDALVVKQIARKQITRLGWLYHYCH